MAIRLAGCVIKDGCGRILLLHRNNGTHEQWELPGGKIDEGESDEETAIREIKEELGVKIKITKEVGDTQFKDNGREFFYIWFEGVITSGEPKVLEQETFDDIRYFSLGDMKTVKLSENMKNLSKKLQGRE